MNHVARSIYEDEMSRNDEQTIYRQALRKNESFCLAFFNQGFGNFTFL